MRFLRQADRVVRRYDRLRKEVGSAEAQTHLTSLPYLHSMLTANRMFASFSWERFDIDLLFKEKQHRLSLFHSIEIPFIGLLLFLLVPVRYGYLAACFCAGWVVHLMGDMIQGGVRSLFMKRKVGFKKFYWDRYYNTPLGIFIDLFLLFLGFVGTFKVASEWDIAVLIPFSLPSFRKCKRCFCHR